jgi:hypothetical protein
MRVLQFETFPVWVNFALFGVAAACVWSAGTRLARYADAISARTHLSKAFLGVVVLGVATSLPEIATTITAAAIGNARLVSGNLFGGVALQIAVLAVVDLIAVRGALTFFTPQPVLLFQGVMPLLLLSLALAGAVAGEPISLMGLGVTPMLLALGYAVTVKLSQPGEYLPCGCGLSRRTHTGYTDRKANCLGGWWEEARHSRRPAARRRRKRSSRPRRAPWHVQGRRCPAGGQRSIARSRCYCESVKRTDRSDRMAATPGGDGADSRAPRVSGWPVARALSRADEMSR